MKTILDGGLYYESPRWHAGRLWFVDCWTRKLLSVSLAGDVREHATFDDTPCGTGVLPDGRLVILTMFKSACSPGSTASSRPMPTCQRWPPARSMT